MNTYGGNECIDPRILEPRHLFEVSGQLHVPTALPPGKEPRHLFDRRLGGPQSRS
jgi:hypothetical protein